jgi:hypothetical protein
MSDSSFQFLKKISFTPLSSSTPYLSHFEFVLSNLNLDECTK